MPNAAQVKFKTTNLTQQTTTPLSGISFVLGQTLMGKENYPNEIMNSWEQFRRTYGELSDDFDFPYKAKKILDAGGKLRVCKIISSATPPVLSTGINPDYAEFDDDISSGDEITVSINSVNIGSVTFTTDHLTTINLVIDLLESHDNISSAVLLNGDNNNYIILITYTLEHATVAISNTGTASCTVTGAGSNKIVNEFEDPLFYLKMKNKGYDYANILVSIISSTNGDSDYFGIKITHANNSAVSETYNNLKVIPSTISNSHYLDVINQNSNIVEVDYVDTSSIGSNISPQLGAIYGYTGTTDTLAATVDYINGFQYFDDYDDALQIAVLDGNESMIGLHEAGANYANTREDLVYFAHLKNSNADKDAYISGRGTSINTKFCAFYGGGVNLLDPFTGISKSYSELSDIIIAANSSDENYSPYYSFAGPNRGLISGILGIVNNYGSNAKYSDLNELANHQINMAINRDSKTMLWGNFTSQTDDNQEKYLHIVRGMITMIKTLRPTLETFLEDPCAPPTWNRMYYTVKPFLDGLVGEFFHTYEWVGDQYATGVTDADLQVNTAADVADGKYKVKLIVTLIASMQEIEVEIISTVAGVQVSF